MKGQNRPAVTYIQEESLRPDLTMAYLVSGFQIAEQGKDNFVVELPVCGNLIWNTAWVMDTANYFGVTL